LAWARLAVTSRESIFASSGPSCISATGRLHFKDHLSTLGPACVAILHIQWSSRKPYVGPAKRSVSSSNVLKLGGRLHVGDEKSQPGSTTSWMWQSNGPLPFESTSNASCPTGKPKRQVDHLCISSECQLHDSPMSRTQIRCPQRVARRHPKLLHKFKSRPIPRPSRAIPSNIQVLFPNFPRAFRPYRAFRVETGASKRDFHDRSTRVWRVGRHF